MIITVTAITLLSYYCYYTMIALNFNFPFSTVFRDSYTKLNFQKILKFWSFYFTTVTFVILTCSHASHIDEPPFGDAGQDHSYPVSSLQAAGIGEHVSSLPGQGAQVSEAPFHFLSFAIHPPQGRVGWPLSRLARNTWERESNVLWFGAKRTCVKGMVPKDAYA